MKIVAPVKNSKEVNALISYGADELFCGIVPKEWEQRFGFESPLNRRETATGNLNSYDELRKIVKLAHNKGVRVHVALNAHYYTQQHHKILPAILERLIKLQVDGLIVADPGILLLIKELKLPVQIIISGEAMATNIEAVDLFRSLGAERIIIPRQVTLEEIGRITKYFRDLEFETFLFSDDCFFEGGICNTIHHFSKNIFCGDLLEKARYYGSPGNLDGLLKANMTLTYFLQAKKVSCGLCSIGSLEKHGISYFKIAARTATLKDRLSYIYVVKKAATLFELNIDNKKIIDKIINIRNKIFEVLYHLDKKILYEFCMLGNSCYYSDEPRLVKKREIYFKNRRISV